LLIGIIVAILNWWLTPHIVETFVEITSLGSKETESQDKQKIKTGGHVMGSKGRKNVKKAKQTKDKKEKKA